MRIVFQNSSHLECIFTDEGITFYGKQQEVYLPYGCIDSIKMSLLGVLQATSHTQICSFAVDHRDRARMKDMVKFAKTAMASAPKAEMQLFDHSKDAAAKVDASLSPEEQLQKYKTLFIRGAISKEEYDVQKRRLKA